MTEAEVDNARNIAAIKNAIKGLSRDLDAITPGQVTELFELQYELIDLMSDKVGLTKEE